MVYSKDSEEEIFNKIFNNYFIKTNSDADVCYTEDIKNIYNLYVDKKNIGINSFIVFLVKNGTMIQSLVANLPDVNGHFIASLIKG